MAKPRWRASAMLDLSLDLRYLKCAICAAEAGSFRKAAELLCLPQSSVSRRMQLFERRLGFPLFKRSSSGIRVTIASEAFLSIASGSEGDRLNGDACGAYCPAIGVARLTASVRSGRSDQYT
ncbi:LysR family transcriptional regulator [Sphingomonas sp. ASY06-1R]|uniref:LysR family transcriptional regulator n=1 Tax=Sphingomonas sp. ASY06-1R TaxID=3445771 RepID=UPI003FA265F2